MKLFLTSRVVYSVLFYLLLILLLIISKPAFMFTKYGDIRIFGVGYGKTIFSFGVFVVALAIMSYYIFCVIDIMFSK